MSCIRPLTTVFAVLVAGLTGPLDQVAFGQQPADFAHDVLPILKTRCASCHSNGTYKSGFSIDTRDSILESGTVDPDAPDLSAARLSVVDATRIVLAACLGLLGVSAPERM